MGKLVRKGAPHEQSRSVDPNLHSATARATVRRMFPRLYRDDTQRRPRSAIEEVARRTMPELYEEKKR